MTTDKGQPTADNQRRFDRGSWLALGFVLGFTALCVAVSAFLLALPGDGCQLMLPPIHRYPFIPVSATGRLRCAPGTSCCP